VAVGRRRGETRQTADDDDEAPAECTIIPGLSLDSPRVDGSRRAIVFGGKANEKRFWRENVDRSDACSPAVALRAPPRGQGRPVDSPNSRSWPDHDLRELAMPSKKKLRQTASSRRKSWVPPEANSSPLVGRLLQLLRKKFSSDRSALASCLAEGAAKPRESTCRVGTTAFKGSGFPSLGMQVYRSLSCHVPRRRGSVQAAPISKPEAPVFRRIGVASRICHCLHRCF
jgi:hypothetical protein